MLRNLKRIYLRREDHLRARAAGERLLLLIPQEPSEVRDRGILLAHLGHASAAVANLEAYLTLDPAAPDAASVRGRLAWLRRRLSQAP
jgi:regulator of sirC expression with transglutaminase-like and TPR domain